MSGRPIPGWAIDLIRDGVPAEQVNALGWRKAMMSALTQTAMVAYDRGWSEEDWVSLVQEDTSHLGFQIRKKDKHRSHSRLAVRRTLADAWNFSSRCIDSGTPKWTKEQLRNEAEKRATCLQAVAQSDLVKLSDNDRLILLHIADQMRSRGFIRVAVPQAATAGALGTTPRVVQKSLARLRETGVIRLDVRGRASEDSAKRRASLYSCPDEAALRALLPDVFRTSEDDAADHVVPFRTQPSKSRTDELSGMTWEHFKALAAGWEQQATAGTGTDGRLAEVIPMSRHRRKHCAGKDA